MPTTTETTEQDKFSSRITFARGDGRTQFRGRLVSAGRIRNALDKPGQITIPAATLEAAVEMNQFNRLAAFVDHAGWFEGPSLRNLFGVWTDIEYNPESKSVDGILNCYDNDSNAPLIDTLNQMLDEDEPPDLGVSIVFYGTWETKDQGTEPRKLLGFQKVESADIVFMPAADGRILEALSALTEPCTCF